MPGFLWGRWLRNQLLTSESPRISFPMTLGVADLELLMGVSLIWFLFEFILNPETTSPMIPTISELLCKSLIIKKKFQRCRLINLLLSVRSLGLSEHPVASILVKSLSAAQRIRSSGLDSREPLHNSRCSEANTNKTALVVKRYSK